MAEIQPLVAGLTLYYVHVDRDRPEPELGRLIWRIEEVQESGRVKSARIMRRWNEDPPKYSELRLDDRGLWAGTTLEVKLPIVLEDSWTALDDEYPVRRVLGVEARASTVVKDFEGCVEVGLTNEDTDSGSRFYAPGLGLVLERWSGESRNTILSLIHWKLPRPSGR